MKTILALILGSLFTFSLNAQEAKSKKLMLKNHFRNYEQYVNKNHLEVNAGYQKLDSAINVNDSQETCFYNDNGNLTLYYRYNWNNSLNQWENSSKYEFTYNESENLTLEISADWDSEINQWINDSKIEYSYGIDGNSTLFLHQWDNGQSNWICCYKLEKNYNSNMNKTETAYQLDPVTEFWVYYYKDEYSYDSHENLTQNIYSEWDTATKQWDNCLKIDVSYDANDAYLQVTNYNWDETTGKWIYESKREASNDAIGNIQQMIYSEWNTSASQWKNNYKEDYSYDASGKLNQTIEYNWDTQESQWNFVYKYEYTYPYSVTRDYLILPLYFYEYEGVIDIEILASSTGYTWDKENSTWESNEQRDLYFSELNPTSDVVTRNNLFDFIIFPNPSQTSFNIKLQDHPSSTITYEVYNISGQRFISGTSQNNNWVINMQGQNKGFYLVKIYLDDKVVSRKIVLR